MISGELSNTEVALLKLSLRDKNGIFIGRISTKLGIPLSDIVNAFRTLQLRGFLKQDGPVLRLTTDGRAWIMQNQSMFAFSGKRHWRDVPDDFKSNRVEPFKPYVPRTSKLSKPMFGIGQKRD